MNNKIKEFRVKNKLTQQQLGDLVGVSRRSIISIESGVTVPSLSIVFKMSKVFNVTIEELFYIN